MKNEIFVLMDDSGKLNINENCCIYGGLFFYDSKDYMNFINKYKSIVKDIRCKYCSKEKDNCNKDCIEIKGTTKIKSKDKRRLFNLLKNQKNFGVFINNKKIKPSIMSNKASRGRYCDYAQKRVIKEIVLYSIRNKMIDPNKPLKLYIKSDECKTKSNGYYNLKDSIYEELVNGIINYDYSKFHKPILNSELDISLRIYDSKKHFGIQSADMISHYLRTQYERFLTKKIDISSTISFIEVKLFIP